MIGIIGAMDIEVNRLIEAMEDKTPETVSRMTFWRGTLAGVEAVVMEADPDGSVATAAEEAGCQLIIAPSEA